MNEHDDDVEPEVEEDVEFETEEFPILDDDEDGDELDDTDDLDIDPDESGVKAFFRDAGTTYESFAISGDSAARR